MKTWKEELEELVEKHALWADWYCNGSSAKASNRLEFADDLQRLAEKIFDDGYCFGRKKGAEKGTGGV